MRKKAKYVWKIVFVIALCISMLVPNATAFYATETDTVVYDSKEELFSAIRKALLPREKVEMKFAMTDRLRDELCYYDEMFHQYFLKTQIVSDELVDNGDGIVYDFNGDQMGIPAKEGDYLIYNAVNACAANIDSYSTPTTIELTASWFMTTAAQEAEFDAKLASLFASGGALAHTKSLSKAEAVVECMKYINANVRSVSSYQDIDHSGYGALCKGQATCEGKSLLLYRLLRELGIPNRILMGMDAAAHTYNIVMIDGKYYYTDPSTSNVILKGSNSFKPATLQPKYLTDAFKSGVLSKISATDYPLNSGSGGNGNSGNSQGGGTTQEPNNPSHTHTAGEWVVDKAATLEAAGSQSKKCTDCGEVLETQEIPKLVEYEVLDGADSVFYALDSTTTEFALRAGGEMEKFVSVAVDGNVVDAKYYTVTSGSTIITFTKEYMDTLADGEHVVTFNFTDGVATANIKVDKTTEPVDEPVDTTETVEDESTEDGTDKNANEAKPDIENKNGIPGYVWVILVVVILAASGVAGFIWYKKKNEGTEREEE